MGIDKKTILELKPFLMGQLIKYYYDQQVWNKASIRALINPKGDLNWRFDIDSPEVIAMLLELEKEGRILLRRDEEERFLTVL